MSDITMWPIKTIDGQWLAPKDITIGFYQSPIFWGYDESEENQYPGFITKIENGSYMIQQVTYRDQLRELKKEEGEKWQHVNWLFRNETAEYHRKHLKEDKDRKIYYIVGIVPQYDIKDNLIGIDICMLKKISAENDEDFKDQSIEYLKWFERQKKRNWFLQSWQIPIFTIIGALMGVGGAVIGSIIIEILKTREWYKTLLHILYSI